MSVSMTLTDNHHSDCYLTQWTHLKSEIKYMEEDRVTVELPFSDHTFVVKNGSEERSYFVDKGEDLDKVEKHLKLKERLLGLTENNIGTVKVKQELEQYRQKLMTSFTFKHCRARCGGFGSAPSKSEFTEFMSQLTIDTSVIQQKITNINLANFKNI